MKQPNILWICTDSQRWDTLGCYGNPHVHTPNLDRFAQQSILFENAFCCNPLCTPSRGNFLTGRYPVTTGLRQNGQDIRPSERVVPRLLADNGYLCGLSGKLHLCACDHRIKNLGPEGWWKYDAEYYFKGVEPRIDDGYTEFHWDHAPSGHCPSSAYTRWLLEQGQRMRTPPREDCRFVHHGMAPAYHQSRWCGRRAIDFMRAHAGKHYPWLFSVNIFDPHFEFNPPDEYLQPYLERIDEVPLPLWREGELDAKPPFHARFASGKMGRDMMSERDHRMLRAAYWAMCDLIDTAVGEMLDALDETGQRENTIVIFMSDHGELLGDHGMYHKGPLLYEGAVHVPLMVSYPAAIAGGKRTRALVELGDLAPSLLDAAGVPRYNGMQARSLWPLLTGEAPLDTFRDDVYCEYYNSNPGRPPQYCTMVRTAEHKIVVWHGQEVGELYELNDDPGELVNLWDDPACGGLRHAMMKRVCDRMAWTADPLPERIGIY